MSTDERKSPIRPTSDNQATTTLLVIESTSRFAPLLSRTLGNAVETRTADWSEDIVAPITPELTTPLPLLLVGVMDDQPARAVRRLAAIADSSPDVSVLVIIRESQRSLEWTLRETGAISIVDEYIATSPLVELCQRLLDTPHTRRVGITRG